MHHIWNGLFSVDACATGRLLVVHQCTIIARIRHVGRGQPSEVSSNVGLQ